MMGLIDALADFIVRMVRGHVVAEERRARRLALAARARVAAERLEEERRRAMLDRGEF